MMKILFLCFAVVFSAAFFQARADDSIESATVKDGKVYAVRGGKLELLTETLKFPSEVEITTNGGFHVANGINRDIQENQMLRSDGWLLNPDGSIEPVFDHIAMKEGKVILVKDGQKEALTKTMDFPNKLQVNPDGNCVYPSGARSRLIDGQIFRLDGTAIPLKDTVTLKNGTMVVQKDGKLISLSSIQIMGMNDGSRVHGDGFFTKKDGARIKLQEGQTILVDGPLIKH